MDTKDTCDRSRRLTAACDGLRAVRSMMLTVGAHGEYANAYEAPKVIDRAPESIIGEMQDAIDAIDAALIKNEEKSSMSPIKVVEIVL